VFIINIGKLMQYESFFSAGASDSGPDGNSGGGSESGSGGWPIIDKAFSLTESKGNIVKGDYDSSETISEAASEANLVIRKQL
jgi:hypothetical protein